MYVFKRTRHTNPICIQNASCYYLSRFVDMNKHVWKNLFLNMKDMNIRGLFVNNDDTLWQMFSCTDICYLADNMPVYYVLTSYQCELVVMILCSKSCGFEKGLLKPSLITLVNTSQLMTHSLTENIHYKTYCTWTQEKFTPIIWVYFLN